MGFETLCIACGLVTFFAFIGAIVTKGGGEVEQYKCGNEECNHIKGIHVK